MNSNYFYREDEYVLKIIPVSKEDDKNSCHRLLTFKNRHLHLCHKVYDEKYINSVIESSNYLLYYHTKQSIEEIICFALIEINKKVCDIHLVCSIQNNQEFGRMIAYSVYEFAIKKKCNKIYTSLTTELLRTTFIKYGFEHLRGIKDYDEVLVKKIEIPIYKKQPFTQRRKRISNTKKFKIIDINNQDNILNIRPMNISNRHLTTLPFPDIFTTHRTG
jgi:hypothetical protein